MVILTHVAEHWHIFLSVGWGLPDNPGHYLDLTSAILGITFLLAAATLALGTTAMLKKGASSFWLLLI